MSDALAPLFDFDGGTLTLMFVRLVLAMLLGLAIAWVYRRARPANGEADSFGVTLVLLTILIGPFVSGSTPFGGGAGNFFSQVWLYGGFAIVGTLLGFWTATALGRDYRSRSLKAYTQARATKPRRVVRR